MPNRPFRGAVFAAASLLVFPLLLNSQPLWRSQLYPTTWQPPVSIPFTEPMLQDWSYAGAFEGRPIPRRTGPVFDAVSYGADPTGTRDSTNAIQRAIDAAGTSGGVVSLPAGSYRIHTQPDERLRLRYSNVVLRGAGVGETFLLNTNTDMRRKAVIGIGFATTGGWEEIVGAPVRLSADVLTPTDRIPVESTEGFAAGDNVVIAASLTQAFINELDMAGVWREFDPSIRGVAFSRRITKIEPGAITVDTPVRFYLKTRDHAVVYFTGPIIENSGIEDLSIGNIQHGGSGFEMEDYDVPGSAAYDVHSSRFIDIHRARNVWLKNIATFRPRQNTKDVHVLSNAVSVRDASHVTIRNVHVARPEYLGEGGNGYGFQLAGQEILVQDSSASYMRHGLAFGGMQCSGNVVHRSTIAYSKTTPNGGGSDFHRFMSQSNLVDNLTINEDFFHARYRSAGSPTHGVTATQSVFYNTRGRAYHPRHDYIIASAQPIQGYIIGTSGRASNVVTPADNRTGSRDWLEGEGRGDTLTPVSLYGSQVARRLGILHVAGVTAASFQSGNPPENTIDGSLGTRWSAEGRGGWITYDLGEDQIVHGVGIAFYRGTRRIAYFLISTSNDQTMWSPALSLQSSGATNEIQRFDIPDVTARYVRITLLGNTENDFAALTETVIYGPPDRRRAPPWPSLKRRAGL